MAGRSSFVLDFGSIGFDSSVTLFTIIIPKRQDENLHRMIQAHTAAAHSHHLFWESACVQRRIRCTPHYFIVSSQRVITCCNKHHVAASWMLAATSCCVANSLHINSASKQTAVRELCYYILQRNISWNLEAKVNR